MNTSMSQLRFTLFVIAASLSCIAPAGAEDALEDPPQPVVVEMFLSQACVACPPAADYMMALADRDDVVALAWHIDYWDHVAAPNKGRWKDPFAKPAFTQRQRTYNKKLRGRRALFTPQAIVNGSASIVGSHRDKVDAIIGAPRAPGPAPAIRFAMKEDELQIAGDNLSSEQMVYVISFRRREETPIEGGSNAGVYFINANIVDEFKAMTAAELNAEPFTTKAPEDNRGCAVIIQEPEQGAIAAAAYCPGSS